MWIHAWEVKINQDEKIDKKSKCRLLTLKGQSLTLT